MSLGDIVGVLIVYLYVGFLLYIFEFRSNEDLFLRRKLIHIMVGNIVFILPLFDTRWVMVGLAAAPFIILTFLISPLFSIGLNSETSNSGHGLGLFYYSISWTILAFLFFEDLGIIAVGIICMSYGDGMASLIGRRFGKHRFNLTGDEKSFEGSVAMIFFSFGMSIIALFYLDAVPERILILPLVVLIATLVEILSVRGLDNLLVALSSSITYYILLNL
ncbi:MAG: phosphatidate cytidylyltransferase [Candidatus Thermoplasmatota archaeon]|nr:phosphatidate cytidylyltransferase [Candidatus Thermoplasmatota archaeon]